MNPSSRLALRGVPGEPAVGLVWRLIGFWWLFASRWVVGDVGDRCPPE